jgi:hypothetical protein
LKTSFGKTRCSPMVSYSYHKKNSKLTETHRTSGTRGHVSFREFRVLQGGLGASLPSEALNSPLAPPSSAFGLAAHIPCPPLASVSASARITPRKTQSEPPLAVRVAPSSATRIYPVGGSNHPLAVTFLTARQPLASPLVARIVPRRPLAYYGTYN